jgi:hypothetical protein
MGKELVFVANHRRPPNRRMSHIPSRQAWDQARLLILLSSGVTYLMKTAVLSLNLAFQGAILPTTISKDRVLSFIVIDRR